MRLLLAGAVDGKIIDFYNKIKALQEQPEWILSVGDWGTWPDKAKVDRGTRQSVGAGDFPALYANGFPNAIQTVYISGVHEDHNWLKQRQAAQNMEVLPNVHWLATGYRTNIGNWNENIRITGFGKTYSEQTFSGVQGKRSHRHYTRPEFEKACSSGPTDILLVHHMYEPVIRKIIFATQPKLIVFSAKTTELTEIMGVQAIGLSKSEIYMFDTKLLNLKKNETFCK